VRRWREIEKREREERREI
jgi:hypothetical protein